MRGHGFVMCSPLTKNSCPFAGSGTPVEQGSLTISNMMELGFSPNARI